MAPLIPKNADMYSIEWKLFLIKSICVFLRSLFVFAPELKMDMVMLKASGSFPAAPRRRNRKAPSRLMVVKSRGHGRHTYMTQMLDTFSHLLHA